VTVGFFSPLPPARTGVADYSAALLEALGQRCEVKVGDTEADVCLYHLGNNPLHGEIYRQALVRPGVVVLHDAVLHHLLLGCFDRQAYIDEFAYNYGEFERGLAVRLWEARGRSALDPRYFDRALVRRIAEVSLAVVVHNPAAARIVRQHAPLARVVEIPHLFLPEWGQRLDTSVETAGRSACTTFLFGVFGHLRESKRIPSILRAFGRVRSAGTHARSSGRHARALCSRSRVPGARVLRRRRDLPAPPVGRGNVGDRDPPDGDGQAGAGNRRGGSGPFSRERRHPNRPGTCGRAASG
jgi:hypothetical protein